MLPHRSGWEALLGWALPVPHHTFALLVGRWATSKMYSRLKALRLRVHKPEVLFSYCC